MIYTFKQLCAQVKAQIDEREDAQTTDTLVKEYVNAANAFRTIQIGEQFLIEDATLTTVSGQQDYALAEIFDKPIYFLNTNTKEWLVEVPNRTLEPEQYNLLTAQGSASEFTYWGMWPVAKQPPVPPNAGLITFFSLNAADVGPMIRITGLDTVGAVTAETVLLNGVTPVSTTQSYQKILKLAKDVTQGRVNIQYLPGTLLADQLQTTDVARQYRVIHLLNSPTTPETISYRFFRKPLPLVDDNDISEIPYPYSQILVYDALLMLAGYNTDTAEKSILAWRSEQTRWEEALLDAFKDSQTLAARSKYTRGVYRNAWLSDD